MERLGLITEKENSMVKKIKMEMIKEPWNARLISFF